MMDSDLFNPILCVTKGQIGKLLKCLAISLKFLSATERPISYPQASQDDATASKEVILVLRKQIQTLQREKETLSAMKPELSEGQLIDILRDKDQAIVELETQLRDVEKEKELLEEKINRMVQDVASYLQLIEVKDESIVKLSNKLDELELAAKMDKAGSPPVIGR